MFYFCICLLKKLKILQLQQKIILYFFQLILVWKIRPTINIFVDVLTGFVAHTNRKRFSTKLCSRDIWEVGKVDMKEQKWCDTAEWPFPASSLSVSHTGSFPSLLLLWEQAVYHLTSQVSVFIKVSTSAVIKVRHTACRHRELNEMLSSLIYAKPRDTINKKRHCFL